jgi:hypothetical protein
LAQVVSPSSITEAVGPLLVGSKVSCLSDSPGLVGRVQLYPKLSRAGEGVGGQKGGGGQDGQGLVGDGQTSPSSLALGVLQEEDVLGDVQRTLVVLAHLNGYNYGCLVLGPWTLVTCFAAVFECAFLILAHLCTVRYAHRSSYAEMLSRPSKDVPALWQQHLLALIESAKEDNNVDQVKAITEILKREAHRKRRNG